MAPARPRLAYFSAALLAALAVVLAVVLPAGNASVASITAAGNRVWAISLATHDHVGADRLVSADQHLGRVPACPFYAYGACVAPEAATAGDSATAGDAGTATGGSGGSVTRVGRWMGKSEFNQMSSTGRVVEGAGGRTYVISPPDPAAYPSAANGSVYAEFDVPSNVLRPASQPNWWQIPGPNITTRIFGPPPGELAPATCIVLVCAK